MKEEGKITLEEHKQLGKLLKIIQNKLSNEADKIKPKTKMRKSHQLKAYSLVSGLRNHLEEIMFMDYPIGLEGLNIYYGRNGEEKK